MPNGAYMNVFAHKIFKVGGQSSKKNEKFNTSKYLALYRTLVHVTCVAVHAIWYCSHLPPPESLTYLPLSLLPDPSRPRVKVQANQSPLPLSWLPKPRPTHPLRNKPLLPRKVPAGGELCMYTHYSMTTPNVFTWKAESWIVSTVLIALYMYMCMYMYIYALGVLYCIALLFVDLACFFLPSFSSLIKTCTRSSTFLFHFTPSFLPCFFPSIFLP